MINIRTIYILSIILLLALSVIDIKTMIIPDIIIIPAILMLFAVKLFLLHSSFIEIFWAPSLAYAVFFIIWYLSKGGMGLGDAKLAAYIALLLGFQLWCISIFISSSLGLIFCLVMVSTKKMERRSKIAFGPFLSSGAVLTMILM